LIRRRWLAGCQQADDAPHRRTTMRRRARSGGPCLCAKPPASGETTSALSRSAQARCFNVAGLCHAQISNLGIWPRHQAKSRESDLGQIDFARRQRAQSIDAPQSRRTLRPSVGCDGVRSEQRRPIKKQTSALQ
jgi:hypothetical protein